MTSSAGDWQDPYRSLLESIEQLKGFAANEEDQNRRLDLESKISDLEARAHRYWEFMRKKEQGNG